MNFNQLRNLFVYGFLFDFPHMIKCGLIKYDLNALVLFPELGISLRLQDLSCQVKHIECSPFHDKKVTITLYNKDYHTTKAFSSAEEAAKYAEYLTYYINLLDLATKKN